MMAWISAESTPSLHPVEEPEVGGLRGTTIGPFTPAGAAWIWAAVAGAIPETERSQQTRVRPTLRVITADPLPFGSPPRISSAPLREVVRGAPAESDAATLGKMRPTVMASRNKYSIFISG